MQLVIVRHGQSTNNARYAEAATSAGTATTGTAMPADGPADGQVAEVRLYPGRVPDPALSALGVRQAEALATALSGRRTGFTPTHLYASATTRAVQTARPLAEVTGLPVVLHPDAHEVGGIHVKDPRTGTRRGHPGATLRELREHCPRIQALPGLFETPDGRWSGGLETEPGQALPRARRLLASLLAAHRGDDVVTVVGHQHFSQFLLAAVFGWSGPPWRRFRVDNTGHLSLCLDGGRALVGWVNRVDHLDPRDVTN